MATLQDSSPTIRSSPETNGEPAPVITSILAGSLVDPDEEMEASAERQLSTFERVFSTHAPIFESLLLQAPTDSIFQLYHTSRYLRTFLRSYPTAWQYLSFRLLFPSGTQARPLTAGGDGAGAQRQSRQYALDQLLLQVILPFSPSLKSLDLDNTTVNGQNLTSTVLNMRRDTLEHLSVRGCKNVSLKYHIIPYLTMFGLQYDADLRRKPGTPPMMKRLALKSLYTYRCRHHRRRPYLTSSLLRRDSDSEPTHDLVNLCHKLGIWTDTAWCTTPAGRCFRRRGYVSMRAPQGTREVWVVFDRLWRSKNWIGPTVDKDKPSKRDGRLWEHDETGCFGEALGTAEGPEYGEGKTVPTHLRQSHKRFVENITCDECDEPISERCEQCSVLMHCVGCRRTLCASCAFDRPYPRRKQRELTGVTPESFWWAPYASTSPCLMMEDAQDQSVVINNNNQPTNPLPYPNLKFHWCCTEPMFTGGGGISIGTATREVDRVRAAPLPRGQGWEDPELSTNEWLKTFPRNAYGDPPDHDLPEGHAEMMRWLLGPPGYQASSCPRNLCQQCFDRPQWKVHCRSCTKPLCMEHDLRGLRLRICGYRDLVMEKTDIENTPPPADRAESRATSRTAPTPPEFDVANPTRGRPAVDYSTSSPRFNLAMINQLSSQLSLDHSPDTHEAGPSAGNLPDGQPVMNRSSTIQTSASTSNNHSRSSSPASIYFEASPEIPRKWMGCQSIFCPQYRAVGDQRQRCSSVLRECTSCSVHVCQDCVRINPPCTCSYCQLHYLCPNCYQVKELDGTCRRLEEERIQREEKQKRDLEMIELAMERNLANEVASFAGQFFSGLMRGLESVGQPDGDALDDDTHDQPPTSDHGTSNHDDDNDDNDDNTHAPPSQAPVHITPAYIAPPGPLPIPANYGEDDNGSGSEQTEIL
ncbi:hypothetical protein FQN55_005630 [Onygenales sp. PD_40]|nr:hypothetical protein FQN55_005630 [Onygenales sp. PD_40]KAK2780012.1 hypothetical protein FQN53_001127 [Emmonsiellopsis sp. PD_33]KAK2783396.1 hypothetical protein FQN52_009654 [Onygenales sp. PD_12]KAK2792327.1 hypothetical protein FQN51_001719 [Onygenales sp. PD_10]